MNQAFHEITTTRWKRKMQNGPVQGQKQMSVSEDHLLSFFFFYADGTSQDHFQHAKGILMSHTSYCWRHLVNQGKCKTRGSWASEAKASLI